MPSPQTLPNKLQVSREIAKDPRTSALFRENLATQLNLSQSSTQGQAKAKASVFRYQKPLLRRNEKHPRARYHYIFQSRQAGVLDQKRGPPSIMNEEGINPSGVGR